MLTGNDNSLPKPGRALPMGAIGFRTVAETPAPCPKPMARHLARQARAEDGLGEKIRRQGSFAPGVTSGVAHCRVLVDVDGKPTHYQILQANEAYLRLAGVTKADLEGRRAWSLLPDQESCVFDFIGIFGRVALDGGETRCETYHEASGKYLSLYAYSPLPCELTVIIDDLTARRRGEEAALALNAELERRIAESTAHLERALSEQESFSYSVSHDLRAPLRHINSFSAILMEDFASALPETARNYLQRIEGATRRMGELIDHLLELSRVSRTKPNLEQVDLSELATAVAARLRENEPQRCVEFSIMEGVLVRGDRALLKQLLEQLFGNAWKYSRVRSAARIEFRRQDVAGRPAFLVKDNGVGFDMEYCGNLFKNFQRLHGAEYEGVGIGLAIAKSIVQRHGGTIWAQGEADGGATFFFSLRG